MNYFQQKLKQLMKARQLNQTDLAKLSNIPQTTISKWLTKESTPKITTIEPLAKALNISVSELVGDFGNNIKLTEDDKRWLALPDNQKKLLLTLLDAILNSKI